MEVEQIHDPLNSLLGTFCGCAGINIFKTLVAKNNRLSLQLLLNSSRNSALFPASLVRQELPGELHSRGMPAVRWYRSGQSTHRIDAAGEYECDEKHEEGHRDNRSCTGESRCGDK